MDFDRILTIIAIFGTAAIGVTNWLLNRKKQNEIIEEKKDSAESRVLDLQNQQINLYEKTIGDQKTEIGELRKINQTQAHQIGDLEGQLKGANNRITYLETLIRENPALVKQLDAIGKVADAAVKFMTNQTQWMEDQKKSTGEMLEILRGIQKVTKIETITNPVK